MVSNPRLFGVHPSGGQMWELIECKERKTMLGYLRVLGERISLMVLFISLGYQVARTGDGLLNRGTAVVGNIPGTRDICNQIFDNPHRHITT